MWFKPSRCVSCFLAALPLDIPAACHLEVADVLFSFAVTLWILTSYSLSHLICRSWLFKVALSLQLIGFHSIMCFTKKFRIQYQLHFEKGARGIHSDYAVGWTIWGSMPGTGNRFVSSPKHPDRLWDPHSPLFYGYQGLLSWAHSASTCRWPCTSVECPMELYLCSLPTFFHDLCSDNFIFTCYFTFTFSTDTCLFQSSPLQYFMVPPYSRILMNHCRHLTTLPLPIIHCHSVTGFQPFLCYVLLYQP